MHNNALRAEQLKAQLCHNASRYKSVSSQESMSHTIHQEVIGKNLDPLIERASAVGDINYQNEKYESAISEAINTRNEEILQYLADVIPFQSLHYE